MIAGRTPDHNLDPEHRPYLCSASISLSIETTAAAPPVLSKLRRVNAQIEFLLRNALAQRGMPPRHRKESGKRGDD
jgi:hypothetical protein